MSTIIEATIVDPAERDEVPRCWTGEARGFAGRFSFSSATRPWNWMELDAEDADKLFTLLSGFVSYFNARYGQCPEQRIPPCWAEHGALVEELTTLFWARWHAFESATRFDRRRAVLAQLHPSLLSRADARLARHRPRRLPARTPPRRRGSAGRNGAGMGAPDRGHRLARLRTTDGRPHVCDGRGQPHGDRRSVLG